MDPAIFTNSRVVIVLAFEQDSLAVRFKEKIMFADRATIIIKSGKGGDGHEILTVFAVAVALAALFSGLCRKLSAMTVIRQSV